MEMFFLNVGLRENIFRTVQRTVQQGFDKRHKTAQRGTFEGHSRINKNRRALSCIKDKVFSSERESFSPASK